MCRYSENVKRRSAIMKDQPIKPLDSAVYWSEYVIRHRGAPHFRSAALDLTWYQYYMVDVIVFIFAVLAASGFAGYYVLLVILRKLCTKTNKKVDKRKKKN